MFEDIREYIKRPLSERQLHLKLGEACIEIGGYDSREFRGLLAHSLKTTIPTKIKVILCHACNNHWCSNPCHMYWGTYKENLVDSIKCGRRTSMWESIVKKLGEEGAHSWITKNASKAGTKGGGSNRLSMQDVKYRREQVLLCDPKSYGWVGRAAKVLGITHTQVRRFASIYMDDIFLFQRKSFLGVG